MFGGRHTTGEGANTVMETITLPDRYGVAESLIAKPIYPSQDELLASAKFKALLVVQNYENHIPMTIFGFN
ncbi:MAG TPA: hypothetical protein VEL11_00905 [Candidatus Bathyarchaeia archaeon]|nr:hypothetical protein [Candidatus Bathyarchaeia archaeon]HYA84532.1 hypothetical protein [Candidatus Bathyarchaeia archaeon]